MTFLFFFLAGGRNLNSFGEGVVQTYPTFFILSISILAFSHKNLIFCLNRDPTIIGRLKMRGLDTVGLLSRNSKDGMGRLYKHCAPQQTL